MLVCNLRVDCFSIVSRPLTQCPQHLRYSLAANSFIDPINHLVWYVCRMLCWRHIFTKMWTWLSLNFCCSARLSPILLAKSNLMSQLGQHCSHFGPLPSPSGGGPAGVIQWSKSATGSDYTKKSAADPNPALPSPVSIIVFLSWVIHIYLFQAK